MKINESNLRETLEAWNWLPDFKKLIDEIVANGKSANLSDWMDLKDYSDLVTVVAEFLEIDNNG